MNISLIFNVNTYTVPFYLTSHWLWSVEIRFHCKISDKKNNSSIMTFDLLFNTYYVLDVKNPEIIIHFLFLEKLLF